MKLGFQETGISTKDVVFVQVLDLFRRGCIMDVLTIDS